MIGQRISFYDQHLFFINQHVAVFVAEKVLSPLPVGVGMGKELEAKSLTKETVLRRPCHEMFISQEALQYLSVLAQILIDVAHIAVGFTVHSVVTYVPAILVTEFFI